MSWTDRINDSIIITTGDGRVYRPLYVRLSKQREYNLTEFNFPGLDGTFPDRRRPKGIKYSLEIIFKGDNHLTDAADFDRSALDSRAWVVEHPLYGRIVAQPTGLEFDDRSYNITRITSTLIETNDQPGLAVSVSPSDAVALLVNDTMGSGVESFVQKPVNAAALTRNNGVYFAAGVQIVPLDGAEDYTNLFDDANAAANNILSGPSAAITQAQALVLAPAAFAINLQTRLNSLINQLQTLYGGVDSIDSVNEKIFLELSAGGLVAAMCSASANPVANDYTTVDSVFAVVDQVIDQFAAYVTQLDALQTDNNGNTDSYVPDFEFISDLTYLVDFTISNLISIGLNASQERIIYLPFDTNMIDLANQYYPNTDIDTALELVLNANGWGISSVLGVSAGTKFVYYVQ
jgi:hypothetical protein